MRTAIAASLLLATLLPGLALADATLPGARRAEPAWTAERMWWLSYRRDARGLYYWLSPDGQNAAGEVGRRSDGVAALERDLGRVRAGERVRFFVAAEDGLLAPPDADKARLRAWARRSGAVLVVEPEEPWPAWLDASLLAYAPPRDGEAQARARIAVRNLTAYRFRMYSAYLCTPTRQRAQVLFDPPLEVPPFARITPEVAMPPEPLYDTPGACTEGAGVQVGQTEIARAPETAR